MPDTILTATIPVVDSLQPALPPLKIEHLPEWTDTTVLAPESITQRTLVAPSCSVDSTQRTPSPLHDNGTMLLVLAVIFLLTVTYGGGRKYFSNLFHNMFSIRRRENLFEDHTVNETRILIVLFANTGVFISILLYQAFAFIHPSAVSADSPVFLIILALLAGVAVFYLLQLGLYHLLGYVFAIKIETKLWLDGFKASQSLLGIVLAPVAFVSLLVPGATHAMLVLAAIAYLAARLVFVCKGFRIFFNNLSSLHYFILYLCGVEIVPVILSLTGAMQLCIILQPSL